MPVLRKRTAMKRCGMVTSARDAVWEAIRELRDGFEVVDVASLAKVPEGTAREHLRRLTAAGVLSRTPGRQRPWPYRDAFALERDVGVDAPRVRRDGSLDQDPSNRDRLWAAMKALRSFTLAELRLATGIQDAAAQHYIRRLERAGYLFVVLEGAFNRRTGLRLQSARWRLKPSMDTGPRPPEIHRGGKVVFDPNLGRYVP